jgi:predicted nucleotidyltransferase
MTLSAPTIDIRDRIPEEVIRELVAQIASEFQPKRIILFGSYAYGNPRPESDVDLLVIMDTPLSEIEQALQIRRKIKPRFGVDLLVYKPARLEDRVRLGDWFLREITERGSIVYESANP